MNRKNTLLLTLSQIGLGGGIGLIGGLLGFLIFDALIGEGILGTRLQHGFWVSLLILACFGGTYGAAIAGVAEGVRFAGRRFGTEIERKSTYQGAFLGAPAIVALLSLLNIHWEAIAPPNMLVYLILPVLKITVLIITLPLQILLWMKLPPELLYLIAAPIGAILGYRLDWSHIRKTDFLT